MPPVETRSWSKMIETPHSITEAQEGSVARDAEVVIRPRHGLLARSPGADDFSRGAAPSARAL